MINEFIETCKKNKDKVAFIFKKKSVTFGRLLDDVYKMVNYFKSKNLMPKNRVLLYFTPSYDFYVLIFACVFYGINIVVLDDYKNFKKIRETMVANKIDKVFFNKNTILLKSLFLKGTKGYCVSDYKRCSNSENVSNIGIKSTILTTFTSGTTGERKAINRTIEDLCNQITSIRENVNINNSKVVLGALPIYVLFVVFSGFTCVIESRVSSKNITNNKVDTLIVPIAKLLKLNDVFRDVKKVYCGGARLYKTEVTKLNNAFPNAEILYTYGATECALIATGDLNNYLENNFAIQSIAKGINIEIKNKDKNGIGIIAVKGRGVLVGDEYLSGDLGYIDNKGLHIVGRRKYSSEGNYNYLIDDKLAEENPKVKRGFSFVINGKVYYCYEGQLTLKSESVNYYKFIKLPLDAKHKTKLNYTKAIQKIFSKK